MSDNIELSEYTKALIETLKSLPVKKPVDDLNALEVSPTASFFGLLYEKIRNAIEYREESLIRRAAIERILKRRWLLNPSLEGEAENILRELLWARYFPPGSLSEDDVEKVQQILDRYLVFIKKIIAGRDQKTKETFTQFLISLLTCEIEETLAPQEALKREYYMYFIFQVLKGKVKLVDEKDESLRDLYVFLAVDKFYFKSDKNYLRYHLFKLLHGKLSEASEEKLQKLIFSFPEIFDFIEKSLDSAYIDKIGKLVKKEKAAFLILEEVLETNKDNLEEVLTSKSELERVVDDLCSKNYERTKEKVKTAAIRGFIYIFLTKMGLALILEYPLSLYLYGKVDYFTLSVNSLFPPFLMFAIAVFTKTPNKENTKRIFERIVHFIDKSPQYEKKVALITKKPKEKNPALIFAFTVFYGLTFVATFSLIFYILDLLRFNLISKLIFVFFVSLVSFFGYRVRQIAKEYFLVYKQPLYQPLVDFFFMPILSIGKALSQEIGRFNFLIVFFDFIIEAPFKLIVEVIEEWVRFVRARKEEIE